MKLEALFNLPPLARRLLLVIGDTLAVLVAVWASFAIRLGEWWPDMLQEVIWLFPLAVVTLITAFALVGLYRPILRYADESLLYTIVLGVSTGILLLMAIWVFLREGLVPRSSWLIGWLVLVALVGGGRLLLRRFLRRRFRRAAIRTPVIIYGAGEAGAQLVHALRYSTEFEPVAFVEEGLPSAADHLDIGGDLLVERDETVELRGVGARKRIRICGDRHQRLMTHSSEERRNPMGAPRWSFSVRRGLRGGGSAR